MTLAFRIFLALYIVALALFAISVFGLFGQDRDPMGAVFLLPLGLPWVLAGDRLGADGSGLFVALAPAVNLALLYALMRWRQRRA